MSLLKVNTLRLVARRAFSIRAALATGDGSGVGHGGGAGGSIREAGGKLGEIEAAAENTYFRKLQTQQLEALKRTHEAEIKHHEEEIKRHQEAIARHRALQSDLGKKE